MDPVIQVCMWATQSMEIHYFTMSNLSTGGWLQLLAVNSQITYQMYNSQLFCIQL